MRKLIIYLWAVFSLAPIAVAQGQELETACSGYLRSGLGANQSPTGTYTKYRVGEDSMPEDCNPVVINDQLAFSSIQIELDPGYAMTMGAPYGLLETGAPVATPAYSTDVSYDSLSLGLGIDAQVHAGGFAPFGVSLHSTFGKTTGQGSSGPQSFANLGVPSVGLIDGAFSGGSADVLGTEIAVDRTFGSFDKGAKFPLFGDRGKHGAHEYAYTGYGVVGGRFGFSHETQAVDISTSAGTVFYDTVLDGGFGGIYGGLGVDKRIDLPSTNMQLGLAAEGTLGLDFHRYRVTDTVGGTFGGLVASTNTYDISGILPTAKLQTGVYLRAANIYFGLETSVSTGDVPHIAIDRPISDQPETPTASFLGPFTTAYRLRFNVNLPEN